MLGINFNNKISDKIDGWLKTTIDNMKPSDNVSPVRGADKDCARTKGKKTETSQSDRSGKDQ